MARKTAMGKEPGNVSIALPQSEKDRLRNVGRRLPGKSRPIDDKGNFTDKQYLDRVSPGIYRNSKGQLTNSFGRVMERKQPQGGTMAQALAQQTGMQAAPVGAMPDQQSMDAGQQAAELAADPGAYQQYTADMRNKPYPMGQMPQGGMSMADINRFGMADIRNMPQQGIQDAMLRFSPEEQQRMQANMPQNLMYQYPPGQTPNFGALFNYGQRQQEQQQQPNSVSGLLQRRFK